jgi:short subunit dehydrogenase-like uncharacterized protein
MFVVQELQRRGFPVIVCGRDGERLRSVRDRFDCTDIRVASVDDGESLAGALQGADAAINCAGPFGDTAIPIIEAARRQRIPYLDVTAEAAVVLDLFKRYANVEDIAILPASAFYGTLADLLATAAMDDWQQADEVIVAFGLSSWVPTAGTRATIAKRAGRRIVFARGRLEHRSDEQPAPHAHWQFGPPFGEQEVATEVTTSDVVTIPHHLEIRDLRTYLNVTPIADLADTQRTGPVAVDEIGRSSQEFRVEVAVRREGQERQAVATGRDIYATSAPIVVEALSRVLKSGITGIRTAAQAFTARDFLKGVAEADPFFSFNTRH